MLLLLGLILLGGTVETAPAAATSMALVAAPAAWAPASEGSGAPGGESGVTFCSPLASAGGSGIVRNVFCTLSFEGRRRGQPLVQPTVYFRTDWRRGLEVTFLFDAGVGPVGTLRSFTRRILPRTPSRRIVSVQILPSGAPPVSRADAFFQTPADVRENRNITVAFACFDAAGETTYECPWAVSSIYAETDFPRAGGGPSTLVASLSVIDGGLIPSSAPETAPTRLGSATKTHQALSNSRSARCAGAGLPLRTSSGV